MYSSLTTVPEAVDSAFWFITIVSIILLVGITATMIYFAVKYSRKKHPVPVQIEEKAWVEITWTVLPTILVLLMFWFGYEGFKLMRDVPEDAMQVKVIGRMWDWSFEYENGKTTDKLYVPVEKNVKLNMRSIDVVHSLYIPAYRIKEDLVPGRDTYLWFQPQSIGKADIFCAEFCGQRHAYMLSEVVVMDKDEFIKWYDSDKAEPDRHPVIVLMENKGCFSCHSMTGTLGNKIPLMGIPGQKKIVIRDGIEVELVADEEYIRRAITDPKAEKLKGHPLVMRDIKNLSPEDINLIIDFITGKR